MKAIFLSAGRGTRLFPLTKNTPKPLLDIGEGLTIIESQLNALVECGGIDEAIFVVGYKIEQIEAKLHSFDKIPVHFIYNPFYMTSNNLISLWLALPSIDGDFVVINGDDIFHSEVLRRLIDEPKRHEITMVIDRKERYSEEDMKVVSADDRILRVSKAVAPDQADGESIGMFRFLGRGAQILRDTLNKMVRVEESKNVFYLEAIQQIIDAGIPVHFSECSPDEWTEIDFHPDLNSIRDNLKVKFMKYQDDQAGKMLPS